MLIILVAGLANVGDLLDKAGSEAERAGAAVGTTLGIAIILFFWVVGTVILGMLALVTRGSKRVIIEEVSRLVLLLLAVTTSTAYAGDIPKFDVDGYCNRIADQIGGSNQLRNSCINQEQGSYNSLKAKWISIPTRTHDYCTRISLAIGGSYNILQTCIRQELDASAPTKFKP